MTKSIKNTKKFKQKQKDIKEKIGLFDKLPSSCLLCLDPFDRMNKEQVQSWFVVVRQERVGLYCPSCWNEAQKIIKDLKEKQNK